MNFPTIGLYQRVFIECRLFSSALRKILSHNQELLISEILVSQIANILYSVSLRFVAKRDNFTEEVLLLEKVCF